MTVAKMNRHSANPGGMECQTCGRIFIGDESHSECGLCHNTRPTAVASHADGEAVAWMHTLHMELGQSSTRLSLSIENPFGIAGEDYSSSYSVTSRPLYANPTRSGDEARDAARWQAFKRYVYETVGGNHLLDRLAVLDIGAWDGCIDELQAAMAARGEEKETGR